MIRPNEILFIVLCTLMTSCMQIMSEPEKHEDFMSHSDCFVYKNEVETETYDFGRVEYIDTSKASGCVKTQLTNTYLLYYEKICVAVYNRHPKEIITPIEEFIKTYQTDTTKLSSFVYFDSTINLTIDRLCLDKSDNIYYGQYVWWKSVEYTTESKPYKKTKDELLQTWYNWTE